MIESEDILSVDELAAILRWDRQKVWRWVREGRIPLLKRVGQAMLFSRSEIIDWAENNGIQLQEVVCR